jgi:hypothetical protein
MQKKSKLETKNKGVAEADKTEDVAEMKRITDGMDAEAKNFEGLKAKTNYSQRLKLDLAWKGINGRLAWLMLFRAVLHQEALAQELWLGLLFTEMLLAWQFFTSMTEHGKSRLVKRLLCLK